MDSNLPQYQNISLSVCSVALYCSSLELYSLCSLYSVLYLNVFFYPTAYGKEGVKMNFVDRIFVGELTNTIMCEECEHVSVFETVCVWICLPVSY